MITAKIEFTNHDTGKVHTIEIDWPTLLHARSASAEGWNASNRLCAEGPVDTHAFRKAIHTLREFRLHHPALVKVLGLAEGDWSTIMDPAAASPEVKPTAVEQYLPVIDAGTGQEVHRISVNGWACTACAGFVGHPNPMEACIAGPGCIGVAPATEVKPTGEGPTRRPSTNRCLHGSVSGTCPLGVCAPFPAGEGIVGGHLSGCPSFNGDPCDCCGPVPSPKEGAPRPAEEACPEPDACSWCMTRPEMEDGLCDECAAEGRRIGKLVARVSGRKGEGRP